VLINHPIIIAILRTQTLAHHSRHLEIMEIVTLPVVTRNCQSTAQGSICFSASVDRSSLIYWDFLTQTNFSLCYEYVKCDSLHGRISSLFLPLTTTIRGDFWKDNFLAVRMVKHGIFVFIFCIYVAITVFRACQVFCARVKKKIYSAGENFSLRRA
jgi:hypothetical protein